MLRGGKGTFFIKFPSRTPPFLKKLLFFDEKVPETPTQVPAFFVSSVPRAYSKKNYMICLLSWRIASLF